MESILSDALGFLGALSRDVVFTALLVALPALHGVRSGKYRLVALNLALYPAFTAYVSVPFLSQLSFAGAWTPLAVFGGLVIVGAFLIGRVACAEFPSSFIPKLVEALALSVSFAGTFLFIAHTELSGADAILLVSGLEGLFTHTFSPLWLATPLAAVALSARRF